MTANAKRADTLRRAIRAGISGDRATLEQLYTDDVKAWTPAHAASSRAELLAELERRDDAFSDVEIDVTTLDVGGDYACAEWRVTMTHSGPLTLRDAAAIEPTDLRITVNGVTVAEFDGDRICALRQYWDELAVYEQLGLAGADGGATEF
jgi:ketosteroid isomerase-like protein